MKHWEKHWELKDGASRDTARRKQLDHICSVNKGAAKWGLPRRNCYLTLPQHSSYSYFVKLLQIFKWIFEILERGEQSKDSCVVSLEHGCLNLLGWGILPRIEASGVSIPIISIVIGIALLIYKRELRFTAVLSLKTEKLFMKKHQQRLISSNFSTIALQGTLLTMPLKGLANHTPCRQSHP